MAKYINNRIKSGRLAGSVYSVRFGEVIERAYNPFVTNPKTQAQVQVRAKFKLLSQLAAVMAPIVAIARQGAVSTRNLFLKENYGAVTYANNKASISLTNVAITNSVVSLPSLVVARTGQAVTAALNVSAADSLSRVVYAMFSVQLDNTLRYVTSRVVSEAGDQGTFAAEFPVVGNSVVIYAYGVRDNTEAARAAFGKLNVPTAQSVAELLVTRALTDSDVTLTETKSQINSPQA